MRHISNKELEAFAHGFDGCLKRLGDGKLAADTTRIRALVRRHPEVAYRFVEIHCVAAQSQPGYLQPAVIVAGAYQAELGDDCLMKMVHDKARAMGAEEHLARVGIVGENDNPMREPPEREAACDWWRRSDKERALCDNCAAPVRRGDGYLISGRRLQAGKLVADLGEELVCCECFEAIKRGELLP